METLIEKIERLKKEKNAIILAHFYVEPEVQKIADYIGDSFYLAKVAKQTHSDTIVFCGVEFMGESAKILNPEKTVLMPDTKADCPMAHMATVEKVLEMKEKYDDLAVVCYINSSAKLKAVSTVCVTSANAQKIVEALPNKNIFFIPDKNLGGYIARNTNKNVILNDGFCPIHNQISVDDIKNAKTAYPNAQILMHPECQKEVLEYADYIGSTSGIIKYATQSDCNEFIIVTEIGVLYELQNKNPNKTFHFTAPMPICVDMKKITLEKIADCLENGNGEVKMDKDIMAKALVPLEKMLELAK